MTITGELVDRPSAVRLQPAYDDTAEVLRVIRAVEPFWPIVRYAGSEKETQALSGDARTNMFVPPWFRRDFALGGEALVADADVILGNPRFVEAAHQVFGPDAVVRPTTVYVNVMVPGPVPFVPHTDVPAFRGVTRDDHPVWLLGQMMNSGLFEAWRIKLATAVSWFYEGPGGEFHYWPEGPDGDHAVISTPYDNIAVVADNERTYHGVAPVGTDEPLITGLTIDTLLHRVDGGWEMRNGDEAVARADDDAVRITVSWKGEVYADEADRERAEAHTDDLDFDRAIDMLVADMRSRGVDVDRPDDPHHDEQWVATVSATYGTRPPRVA
jgi:hypothetical protein